jgi:hypothetical protein
MMNLLLGPLVGLLLRHAIGGLGTWLIAQHVPQEWVDALMNFINVLPPAAQLTAAVVAVGGVVGWSAFQKWRSGALKKPSE